MTSSAKYFIKDSTGSYIDWSYTTVSGFSVADPVATVVGGTGNDAVFAGAGSKVDFTDTGNGDDKLFLTGRFADYTQSVNTASGVYTFTRSSGTSTPLGPESVSRIGCPPDAGKPFSG